MDDASTPARDGGTVTRMDLDTWCDLDLAYLLIFGTHPDLEQPELLSPAAATVAPCDD